MMGRDQDIGLEVEPGVGHAVPAGVVEVAAEQDPRSPRVDGASQPDDSTGVVRTMTGAWARRGRPAEDCLGLLHRRVSAGEAEARQGVLNEQLSHSGAVSGRRFQSPGCAHEPVLDPGLGIEVKRDGRRARGIAVDQEQEATDPWLPPSAGRPEPVDQGGQTPDVVFVVVSQGDQRQSLHPDGLQPIGEGVAIDSHVDETGLVGRGLHRGWGR